MPGSESLTARGLFLLLQPLFRTILVLFPLVSFRSPRIHSLARICYAKVVWMATGIFPFEFVYLTYPKCCYCCCCCCSCGGRNRSADLHSRLPTLESSLMTYSSASVCFHAHFESHTQPAQVSIRNTFYSRIAHAVARDAISLEAVIVSV